VIGQVALEGTVHALAQVAIALAGQRNACSCSSLAQRRVRGVWSSTQFHGPDARRHRLVQRVAQHAGRQRSSARGAQRRRQTRLGRAGNGGLGEHDQLRHHR